MHYIEMAGSRIKNTNTTTRATTVTFTSRTS